MCAKLKCCLNYEVDNYVEAGRKIPSKEVVLQTLDGDYYLFKTDILAGLITYSTDKNIAANLETITAERARLVIEMNKKGEKPDSLHEDGKQKQSGQQHVDLLANENISRFDKAKKKKKKKGNGQQQVQGQQQKQPQQPQGQQQKQPQQPQGQQQKQRRPEGQNRRNAHAQQNKQNNKKTEEKQ